MERVRSPLGPAAAVAAVLRYQGEAPEVLLMVRAVRAGDPWSGHVSLPGGRASRQDASLVETAIREAREELGIDLAASARVVGRLRPLRTLRKEGLWPLLILPFVFVAEGPLSIVPGPEATAAFWLPLDRAARGELTSTHRYRLGPIAKAFPCWRFEGQVVWGLTYRMLTDLLASVRGQPGSQRHW